MSQNQQPIPEQQMEVPSAAGAAPRITSEQPVSQLIPPKLDLRFRLCEFES